MAIALEGVDLVLIALFLFLLAFLHATKWTIEPIVNALRSTLGHVPFVGGAINSLNNDVIAALNGAIAGTEDAISVLWAGTVWAWNQMLDGAVDAWNATAGALEHGFTVTIPNALETLWKDAQHLGAGAGKVAGALEARILAAVTEAEHYADKITKAAITTAAKYADHAVAKALKGVGDDLTTIRTDVKAAASDAKTALTKAENAASGTVTTVTNEITKVVEAALPATIAAIPGEVEGIAAELPQLARDTWDELAGLLEGLDFRTLAGLLGAAPILALLVRTIATEAGLENPECRAKVKQICSTNPALWAHLLEGLAIGFAWDGLENFVEELQRVAVDVAGIVTDFVEAA